MQKIIVLANNKGGSGKSTATVALALCAQRQGKAPVVVVDFDGQGSATRMIEDAKLPLIATQRLPEPNIDCLVFVDTPGLDKATTRRAASHADVIVIPVQMTRTDLAAALHTMAYCKDFGKTTCFLPSRLHSSRSASKPEAINFSLGLIMKGLDVRWPVLPGLRDLSTADDYLRGRPEGEDRPGRKGSQNFEGDVQAAWAALGALL